MSKTRSSVLRPLLDNSLNWKAHIDDRAASTAIVIFLLLERNNSNLSIDVEYIISDVIIRVRDQPFLLLL